MKKINLNLMFLCLSALIPQAIISAKANENNNNSEEEELEVDFRANKNPTNDGACWINDDFGGHSYNGCDKNTDNKNEENKVKNEENKEKERKWTKKDGLGDDKVYVDFNNWSFNVAALRYNNDVYFNVKTIKHFSKKDYELKPLYDILTLIQYRKDSYTYKFLTFDLIYRKLLVSFVKDETDWLKTSTNENFEKYKQSGIKLFFYVMNIVESDPLFEINVAFWFKIFFESIKIHYDEKALNKLIINSPYQINHVNFNEKFAIANIKPRTINIENQWDFLELRKKLNEDFYNNFAINANFGKFLELAGNFIGRKLPIPVNVFKIFSLTKELLLTVNAFLGEDWSSAWTTNQIDFYINFEKLDNWRMGKWNERNRKLREFFSKMQNLLWQAKYNGDLKINDLLILLGCGSVRYKTRLAFFDKIIEHIWMKNQRHFYKNGNNLFYKIIRKNQNDDEISNLNTNLSCLDFLPKLELLNNGYIIKNKNIKYTWLSYYASFLPSYTLTEKINENLTFFSDEILYLLNFSDVAIWKGAFVKNLNDNNYRIFNNEFQAEQWRREAYGETKNISAPPILFLNTYYKDELFKNLYAAYRKNPNNKKIILKYDAKEKTVFLPDLENEIISKGW